MRSKIALVVGFVGLTAAALTIAGPLDPPAGPVAPTFKTLGEIEPRIAINAVNTPGDNDATPSLYKITGPGSYYFTGNVTGVAGKIGVEIAANDVTIDLTGFVLQGVPGSLAGIRGPVAATGLSIRDGMVRAWGGNGIEAAYADASRIENVIAISNEDSGILAGDDAVIAGCVARGNGAVGIAGGMGCTITGCTASENVYTGIMADEASSISGCAAMNNGSHGMSCGGSVVNCTAYSNEGTGFVADIGSSLSGCTAKSNADDGFWLLNAGTATNCASWSNGRDGFLLWYGAAVNGCQASMNGRDGMRLNDDCSAVGNTCWRNGASEPGAGIRTTASACRVDSNQVSENDYGVVAAPDCIVTRNTARGNGLGNYSFALGSEYGQIITNPGNGFTATNPWANFAY
jgi:Right handed beta helix region